MADKKQSKKGRVVQKKVSLAKDFAEACVPYESTAKLREKTNCYTYALGIPEHGHGIPGYLTAPNTLKSTAEYGKKITCSFIFDQLVKDGLTPISEQDISPDSPVNIIAAFIASHQDYHFYRYHKDETWSHQTGSGGKLSCFDNNDDRITDIHCADHEKYKEFVGFFALPEEGIKYQTPKKRWWGL